MEALTNWQRSALDLFGFDGLVGVTPKFMVYWKVCNLEAGKMLPGVGAGNGSLDQLAEIGARFVWVRRVSWRDSKVHGLLESL